jgi:excisionase family DNA binding protein
MSPDQAIHWLGTTEAAERLGIVPRTLYRMIDEGHIPAYKMGRVLRVKESDLDAFLETSRVKPGELTHLYPEPADAITDDH